MDLFEQRNIAPMLIAENKPAFDSSDYTYELKFDGVRCIAYLDHEGIALHNKRNKIVTPIYPEMSGTYKQLKDKHSRCILDGELFVYEEGRTNFFEMQRRCLMGNPFHIKLAAEKQPVTFTAFDILYLDGKQLTSLPLMERMVYLQDAVEESDRLSITRTVEEHGVALYQAAAERGLEGIVAKRKDSRYYFGKRTKYWVNPLGRGLCGVRLLFQSCKPNQRHFGILSWQISSVPGPCGHGGFPSGFPQNESG